MDSPPTWTVRDILQTVTTASPEDALIVNDQLGELPWFFFGFSK